MTGRGGGKREGGRGGKEEEERMKERAEVGGSGDGDGRRKRGQGNRGATGRRRDGRDDLLWVCVCVWVGVGALWASGRRRVGWRRGGLERSERAREERDAGKQASKAKQGQGHRA